jgi:ABC-2 type transport system permease protein
VKALLRTELLKLRTTRTFLALTGAAVATSLLLTILIGALSDPETENDVLRDVFNSDTSGLFILILAMIGITGEWRHRTITSSLLAAPDRLKFISAKTIAFAVAGLVLSVLIQIAIAISAYVIVTIRDLPTPDFADVLEQFARNAGLAFLAGAFGVGLGAIIRNQVVAIVGLLIVAFAIEPALIGLAPEVGRFGPFGALPAAAAGLEPEDVGMPADVDLLPAGVAVLLLLAWIGAAFSIGYATLVKRDLE